MCADAIAVYHDASARGLEASRPFVGNNLWVTSVVDPDDELGKSVREAAREREHER
jgi:hypothetical protein